MQECSNNTAPVPRLLLRISARTLAPAPLPSEQMSASATPAAGTTQNERTPHCVRVCMLSAASIGGYLQIFVQGALVVQCPRRIMRKLAVASQQLCNSPRAVRITRAIDLWYSGHGAAK